MTRPGLLASLAVFGGVLLSSAPGVSQTGPPCRAKASIDKVREDPVTNTQDVQYTFAIRVWSPDKGCQRVTPTIAFSRGPTAAAGGSREPSDAFTIEGQAIVVRGGAGTGRMAHQSPEKITGAKVTALSCGPCEAGDEVVRQDREGKGTVIGFGAAVLAVPAFFGVKRLTGDSFPGRWVGQLRAEGVSTFGVGCALVSSVSYDLGMNIKRNGDSLSGTCSVVPTVVVPAECAFAVPPQSEPLTGTLKDDAFSVTCGSSASRAGILSGATLAGTRDGDRMSGTAVSPLGETGAWELSRRD